MSENKFIKRLKGEQTAKSVLEIKNESAKTSFANMPSGTSNAIDVYSDHRGNATAVLNGTTNWKISNSNLILANDVTGDGADFSSTYSVSGAGLWIDSVYTFPSTGDPAHPVAMVFNPSTKWVLKVCGDNLIVDGGYIVDFTLLVKIGTSNVFTKTFSVAEQAGSFCKEFVLDFNETNAGIIKASGLSTLTVQLLCGTANASARIYNGMTVLTCLQRKVDASAVSTSFANVEEVVRDGLLPNDYFSNAAYIGEVEDGERAYAVFERDGDNMNLAGWDEPIPDQAGNSGKFLTTDGSDMSWYQITASDIGALPDSTKYGASFVLSMNSSTFVITAQLKDQDGNNLGSAQTIDLPLESVVVNGSYDNVTKSLILTLENGNTITIPIADLISGLQEEITVDNKLDADLVDDSTSTNKFVTASDITNWNGHIVNTNNPHSVTKTQVGLGNVDNTSDLNKPISTATQTALNLKANSADLATVATSGDYDDLTNKPTIPAAQVNSDWNAVSGVSQILNKPILATVATSGSYTDLSNKPTLGTMAAENASDYTKTSGLAAVATSGSYNDLSNKPTIPTVNDATLTIQKNGTNVATFTANASSNVTANISVPTTAGDVGAVAANASITGATKCKITYDSKGLVTAGADLAESDIPSLHLSKISDVTASTTELNYTNGVTSNIQTQLNNKISYNAVIQNLNSFNDNGKLFLSTLDNCFYSLNRRFTVTGTGFTSFNAGALFDGVFENYSYNNIDVGGTGVITITGSSITGIYRQGYILISFYSGRGVKSASDVTIQIENSLGNVATLTPTTYSSNGLVLIAEVPTLPTANAIAKITITIVNNRTSGTVNPVELEYFCSRPSNTGLLSYVSKTGNSTIYGGLTADKLIRSGGTSSQFLKADGSVDSTTYAPTSSIPTVNNPTITITQGGITKGSFTLNQASGDTIALDAGGGGSVDIDNLTITKNGDDELQAVATINANTAVGATNPIYDWVGTLAEYQAQNIETLHPDWVCYITDDFSAQAYDAYSKGQTNSLLADKVDKGHQVIEFQEPTSANNYTWYRKYADGWVEQGGVFATVNTNYHTESVALPVAMANANYNCHISCASTGSAYVPLIQSKTTTGFVAYNVVNTPAYAGGWIVCGMAA